MKILIQLQSIDFYTEEQNCQCGCNKIELEWTLPFLPRQGEFFDCESIIENMPDFDDRNLTWDVICVTYEKVKSQILPILLLSGS